MCDPLLRRPSAAVPGSAAAPLFAAEGMGKTFGTRRVLTAASIWVRAGRITALFGRNGSGKSTLLRTAVGLVRADYGAVRFGDRVTERPRLHRLAADGLFYLPERGLLTPRQTVGAHFEALRRRFPEASGRLPDELEPGPVLDRPASRLSGGERRRAELALAWLRRPRVLLGDEPFMGIAPGDAERIAGILRAMADQGCAVLVTGHEVPQLMEIADEVIWMTGGTTHGVGSPAEARRHDSFRRDYLGPGRA